MDPAAELLDAVRSLETQVSALLALSVADRVAENPRAKPRSLDRLLVDAGMTTATVATLLGKSQRAVQLAIAGDNAHE
jgi:hypothetical protein